MTLSTASRRLLPFVAAACLAACQPATPVQTGEDAAEAAQADARYNFQCNELAVGVTYADGGERAVLAYSGRRLALPIAVSASGARYADDAGNEFWSRGDEATLVLAGEERRECATTTRVSPWEQAAERGIVYRAVGQEPGWLVEVTGGEPDTLSAQLDYGQRQVEVSPAGALDGGAEGYAGETADGVPVRLEIERSDCADPMSGERFLTSARLQVGEDVYAGCGSFLER